jgi:hypothetical protein
MQTCGPKFEQPSGVLSEEKEEMMEEGEGYK